MKKDTLYTRENNNKLKTFWRPNLVYILSDWVLKLGGGGGDMDGGAGLGRGSRQKGLVFINLSDG